MVGISLRVILLIGLIVLAVGTIMPAQTVEHYPYASQGPEYETEANPWKAPVMIVGGIVTGYAVLGYKNRYDQALSTSDENNG